MVKRAVIILDWSRLFCLCLQKSIPESSHFTGSLKLENIPINQRGHTFLVIFVWGYWNLFVVQLFHSLFVDVVFSLMCAGRNLEMYLSAFSELMLPTLHCCSWLTFLKCLQIEIKESCPWKSFITLPPFFKITIFSNFAVILWCSLCCYYCSFFAAALVRISMHYTRLKWNKTMSWKLWKTYSIL